jgi:hypothetical protein
MTSINLLPDEDHIQAESHLNKFVLNQVAMKELSIAIPVTEDFEANFLFYQSPNTSKCRFYVSVVDEKRIHFFSSWIGAKKTVGKYNLQELSRSGSET